LKLADPLRDHEVGAVALRYVARAGLIQELSAQTYDAFWKAIREAVLNSIDAGASRVDIFLAGASGADEVVVADNGSGMDLRAFSEHFLSVGGSARFGDAHKFGRIGIGSLALLQYGRTIAIETKVAGSRSLCVAELRHSDWVKDSSRRDLLGDIPAGTAREIDYDGDAEDHFTRIRLQQPTSVALEAGSDPTAHVELTERLRRVLPLPWPTNRMTTSLEQVDPELTLELAKHAEARSAEIVLHSAWDDGVGLVRRQFGERAGIGEDWTGPLFPIRKQIRIDSEGNGQSRLITVAGYLLNQTHASAAWSGVAARVQNVAVEEHTFFDVVADPGFRKYITGEIYILGDDVDRERLINIDRASFNRESADYLAVQRYVADVLQRFKVRHVQQPQRLKVSARKVVQEHASRLAALERVIALAGSLRTVTSSGLPSSGKSFARFRRRSPETSLTTIGCRVEEEADLKDPLIEVDDLGVVLCRVPSSWSHPAVHVHGRRYRVVYGEAEEVDLPVIIRNRPREIAFNLNHEAHRGKPAEALARTFALEIAYLDTSGAHPEELFERVLAFLAVI
jgi:hypothetical protein